MRHDQELAGGTHVRFTTTPGPWCALMADLRATKDASLLGLRCNMLTVPVCFVMNSCIGPANCSAHPRPKSSESSSPNTEAAKQRVNS